MSRFALRFPYFIIVLCLITCVVGITSVVRMPVDLFPPIRIPVVVVATFFSGMPPEQIETDITGRFERFFTLASGVDHIESRSLPGVSLIKIYFQPGFDADSAVTSIANLALGGPAQAPARHAAAGGAEVRCLEPAGVPGDAEGRGPERGASCATSASTTSATRSPTFPAPRCRSPSAAATARSWCTSIRSSCRRTS